MEATMIIRDYITKLNYRYRIEQIKLGQDVVALYVAGLVQRYIARIAKNEKGVVYYQYKV